MVDENPNVLVAGKIQVNDCLLKVDGEDLYRQPIEKVSRIRPHYPCCMRRDGG